MKTITLSDVTQEDFDSAVETVEAGIKAYNRRLDTRVGTVLRDLLVNPEAAVEGVISGQITEARKSSSLKLLQEAQEAGEEIDQEDVNAILSNFNITPSSGTKARGIVKVIVSDGTVAYSVSEGDMFTTSDNVEFTADEQTVACPSGMSLSGTYKKVDLYSGAAGYFFFVSVTASEIGASGNIAQGTSLEPDPVPSSFVMAEAYKDFDGGSDVQDVGAIIESIPSGLSLRGFVNKNAVEGMLRGEFDGGNYPMVAVSTVGYGNEAQLRDRHNLFGVGVGGRIDVYVRNFSDFYTVTTTLEGNKVSQDDGDNGNTPYATYKINIPKGTFPGACWIKSVADFAGNSTDDTALNSLDFTATRTADVSGSGHDFDSDQAAVEAANTVWQGFELTVSKVPADVKKSDESKTNDSFSDTRKFKVTAYCLPQAAELQEYVDRDDIRNVATDVVVRCPIICNVYVNANVIYDPKKPIDEATAKTKIRSYINGLGFVGRITRSEIVQILKNLGALSVEMRDTDMLTGVLHDAKGAEHNLSGDALDIASISDGSAMLTPDTVVFCSEERNIQIKMTPRS